MNINLDIEEARYRFLVELKKTCPKFVAGGVLFNQKVLTACGAIDAGLLRLSADARTKFIEDNPRFFEGFAWMYYQGWRKSRAKSCAHLMNMYTLLNVKLSLKDFVGETFYSGIPLVTRDEVNAAIDKWDTDTYDPGFSREKIGIDGLLHPCDEYGEFLEITDINDVYADGTGVTLKQLNKFAGITGVDEKLDFQSDSQLPFQHRGMI